MKITYPKRVKVYEVGPRDGLQNISNAVPSEVKIRYIDLLTDAGLPVIEATAFVSPRAIPQLGDSSTVMGGIRRGVGVRYPVLVPNEQGMNRALEAGATDVAVFTAASESFALANINCSIQESFARFEPILKIARANGIAVRGYVSTAFGCPFEGVVSPSAVREISLRLLDMGVNEVSVSDTIGVATPADVDEVVGRLLGDLSLDKIAVHFHDTRGTALANVLAALAIGITTFDSSSAGLGGCPYAPGAAGNLATEDLLYMLHGMGIETGVDLDKVVDASLYITGHSGQSPASRYVQAQIGTRPGAA